MQKLETVEIEYGPGIVANYAFQWEQGRSLWLCLDPLPLGPHLIDQTALAIWMNADVRLWLCGRATQVGHGLIFMWRCGSDGDPIPVKNDDFIAPKNWPDIVRAFVVAMRERFPTWGNVQPPGQIAGPVTFGESAATIVLVHGGFDEPDIFPHLLLAHEDAVAISIEPVDDIRFNQDSINAWMAGDPRVYFVLYGDHVGNGSFMRYRLGDPPAAGTQDCPVPLPSYHAYLLLVATRKAVDVLPAWADFPVAPEQPRETAWTSVIPDA